MKIFGIRIPILNKKEILRTVAFLTLLFLTLRETVSCFQRYFDFPKYTSFQLVYQEEVDFPVLTFCPLDNVAYKEKELKVRLPHEY